MCAVLPKPARNQSGDPLPPQSRYSRRAPFTVANSLGGGVEACAARTASVASAYEKRKSIQPYPILAPSVTHSRSS